MEQGKKIPSRLEPVDGDDQQGDAGRKWMPRVVGEMGDCGCCEGAGWLQMRTPAACSASARDSQSEDYAGCATTTKARTPPASQRSGGDDGGWLDTVSHFAATPYKPTHTLPHRTTHQLALHTPSHAPVLASASLGPGIT